MADLVFDVGFHKGEDTDFYLKKGFRVVAVEANPALHAAGVERFRGAIASGQLTLLNAAIAEADGPVRLSVALHTVERRMTSEEIAVPGTRFERIVSAFGVPYYLKINLDGALQLLCLRSLLPFPTRPTHVSLESHKTSWQGLVTEFHELRGLGYRRFKVVSQSRVPRQVCPNPALEGRYVEHRFVRGSSGAFGEEAPGEWLSQKEALTRYRRIFWQHRLFGDTGWFTERTLRRALLWRLIRYLPKPEWYDTHATR